MNDINWGDAPAWVTLVLSFGFSAAAFVISLRGLKWQRINAEAAIRSANTAEKALALTQLVRDRQSEGDLSPSPEVVWRLERHGKQKFVLRNIGSDIATGVSIREEGLPLHRTELPADAAVRPGASIEFLMVATLGNPMPNEIWISWDGASGPVALPIPPY